MNTSSSTFFVIGLVTRTTNSAEEDPSTAQIPGLWERALRNPHIAGRSEMIAVLTDYESDESGSYTQVVGFRASADDIISEGCVLVRVPDETRACVHRDGNDGDAIISAWQQIWKETSQGRLKRLFTTDYEIHSPSGIDIHVSASHAPTAG